MEYDLVLLTFFRRFAMLKSASKPVKTPAGEKEKGILPAGCPF